MSINLLTNIVTFDSQIDQIKKDGATGKDIKKYIVDKFNYYKSSPQGCIDYIQECLYVAVPGVGYQPFALWDTQKRMLTDIVECMFDNKKDMYVLLGSRQCGKIILPFYLVIDKIITSLNCWKVLRD